MPVLKTSASDYTAFLRSSAVLPTDGKATKSTVTTVNKSVSSIVATASKVSLSASPKTSIISASETKSRGDRKGD